MADHTTPHQSFETGVSTRPLVRRYTNEPARGGRSGGRLYLACGRGGAATQEPSLGTSRTARAYGWAALPSWSGSGRSHGSRLSPTRIGVYRSRARHSSSFGARGPECTRKRGKPPPCLHGRWHGEQSAALSSTARGPPKRAAKAPGRRFHQRRSRRQAGGLGTHHEVRGPVLRYRPRAARREERTCTTIQAACFCDVLHHEVSGPVLRYRPHVSAK